MRFPALTEMTDMDLVLLADKAKGSADESDIAFRQECLTLLSERAKTKEVRE